MTKDELETQKLLGVADLLGDGVPATVVRRAAFQIESLRAALLKFVDHFGPLEDNHMLHEDARACFQLARKALGPAEHDDAIRASFTKQ